MFYKSFIDEYRFDFKTVLEDAYRKHLNLTPRFSNREITFGEKTINILDDINYSLLDYYYKDYQNENNLDEIEKMIDEVADNEVDELLDIWWEKLTDKRPGQDYPEKDDFIYYKGDRINYFNVAILMEGGMTKKEAIESIHNGTYVYDSIDDYIADEREHIEKEFKNGMFDEDEIEELRNEYTKENLRAGHLDNRRVVEYEGKEYVIYYIT